MLVNDGINLLIEFVVMTVSLCSHEENHYIIFKAYMYNWMMLLIVLYDGGMLVQMTYTIS